LSDSLGPASEHLSFEKSKIVILPLRYQAANTPRQIILASKNIEVEDLGKELSKIGIHILDEMADISAEELYKVSQQIIQDGKFQVTLSDEAAITSALVKAQLEKWPSMKVLQIDAQVMHQADQDPEWFVKVVDELPEHVYFSIDITGMNQNESQRITDLTRELTHRRNVVGLDLVGLCKDDGQALLCAKLIYKMLGFIFQLRKH
jgi:hypothetical protein